MNKLYDTLEICLNEIEQGADVDTVLFRYPDLANELRPILEASQKAKTMSVPAPSSDVVRRNRAKVLQHAAEIREKKAVPFSLGLWSAPLRRALVTLTVIAALFISGNGLVRAASTTLPGDNLYPVKRTWEGFQLLFAFDVTEREALELEHENERLDELHELIAQGRSADVEFSGYVKNQSGDEWRVDGVTVMVSAQTRLPDQSISIGDAVQVNGQVQSDGIVVAEEIELLAPGSALPEVEDSEVGIKETEGGNENESIEDESGSGSETETSKPITSLTPEPESTPEKVELEGSVTSIENTLVVVNGVVMNISNAEIEGVPQPGAIAKAEGYYDANGIFIVTKIEFKVVDSGGGGSTSGNANDDSNSNSNVNENSNNNDNLNNNDNDSDDDNNNNGG